MDIIIKETGIVKSLVVINPLTSQPYSNDLIERWLDVRDKHDPVNVSWIASEEDYQEWAELVSKKQEFFITEHLKNNRGIANNGKKPPPKKQ